jgi:hypothetical protein
MLKPALLAALAICVWACGNPVHSVRTDSGTPDGEGNLAAPDSTLAAPSAADSGNYPDDTAAAPTGIDSRGFLDVTPAVPSGIESVRFTTSYGGECQGFCEHSLLVRPDGASLHSATYGGNDAHKVDETIDLDPAVTAQILAAAAQAFSYPWDARYGCADCKDQGGFDIEVSANGTLQETFLDPVEHPMFFDPLIAAIKPVLVAHPSPKSICAVAPQDCQPGQVSLVLSLGAGGALEPTWYNDLDHSIFLPGCSTVTFERMENGTVTWSGPVAVCDWEGTARALGFTDLWKDLALNAQGKPGTYRATGTYSEGCTAGKPLSQAACTSNTSLTSNLVVVTE